MESIIAWIVGAILVLGLFNLVRWAIAQFQGRSFRGVGPGSSSFGQTRPSSKLERELTRLMGGNRREAERVVTSMKQRNPGRSEDWYWDKAIYDLRRDRRA
jgi:hypothetical protein